MDTRPVAELEIMLQMVFDWVEANLGDPTSVRLEMGIWDTKSPYTYYARLKQTSGNYIYAGKSSYGSKTIAEAVQVVINDLNPEEA